MKKVKVILTVLVCVLLLGIFMACSEKAPEVHVCTYGEWTMLESASCKKEGLKMRICTECFKKQEEAVPKAEHVYTKENYCEECHEMKPDSYTEGLEISNELFGCMVNSVGNATNESKIVIPAYYEGKAVTTIAAGAFLGCNNVKRIVLPSTIEMIYDGAFSGCSSLEEMTLPTIGYEAYISGGRLQVSTDPVACWFGEDPYPGAVLVEQFIRLAHTDGITARCYVPASLKKITIVQAADSEKSGPVIGSVPIETVAISSSVTSVHNFSDCATLKNVIFEEDSSLTSLGGLVFQNCVMLEKIVLPDSITSIGMYCFAGCTNLTEVILPQNLKTIESGAFSRCEKLESITLPEALTKIESEAFENCTSLKTVYNKSRLSITKGSESNGYVAYYATQVINE